MERARNPRGLGSRLRDEIVDAAVAWIDEGTRPPALTLRGLARRAGITAPSIYTHFADIGAVVDAVLALGFEELHRTMAQAVEGHDDCVAALMAAGGAYVRFAQARRSRYLLMFDAAGYAPNALASFVIVRELIARCVAEGRSRSADPHADTWMVWAALHGAATLQKPARAHLLRLGKLDRAAMLESMICRLAGIGDARGPP